MKNLFFVLAVACVPVLAGINSVHAQSQLSSGASGSQKNAIEIEKAITPSTNHPDDLSLVSPKVLKHFIKTYKNVSDERWMKIEDGYSVKFIFNAVRNIVFYNSKGNWFGSVKGYSEEKLPFEIRDMVKSKFYDYSIFHVDEVETLDSGGKPTYLIHLEDRNQIKLIRVSDWQMEVWKEYTKAQ